MKGPAWLALTAVGVTGLLGGVLLVAQQQPVFRSRVDLVTVDVSALDREGRPIQGLGPDDFTLRVDGEVRPLVSAQYVSQLGPAAGSRASVPLHYSSNDLVTPGRLILIAVDQRHIRRVDGTAGIRAAADFIDALTPADLVGVVGLSRVGAVEFTTDRRAARQQLERLAGEADPVEPFFTMGLAEALAIGDGSRVKLREVALRECGEMLMRRENVQRLDEHALLRDPCATQIEQQARAIAQQVRIETTLSVGALKHLIEPLKDFDGPKTLILLSEGLVAEPQTVDFADLGAAAQAAQVTVYVMQLETPVFEAADNRPSPSAPLDVQLRSDGLARLAGAARGALFHVVGRDPRPFSRISLELSGYYLLAFEPRDSDRDGRLHRIRVTLNRGGGTLRARPAFRLEPADVRTIEDRLVMLLEARELARELPLRVAIYTYCEPNTPNYRVVVSAEADTAAGRASEAALGFVLVDERNVIAASGVHRSESGSYAFSAVVPPGNYTLKVAAIDRLGRRGSAQRPFVARLAGAGGLQVSDLLLGEVPDPPEAPVRPVVDRAPHGRVLGYLELYAEQSEPLDQVRVRVTVTSRDAADPVVIVPAAIARGGQTWAIARAVLPIQDLPAGSYVARAEVVVADRAVAHVTRSFQIVDDPGRARR